ncbi:hypothetical protein BGZ76_006510 [Entomortierella beljakovae]|nr:hypothetical protein BGZ76_006510 [Entomortierella beljakovae]
MKEKDLLTSFLVGNELHDVVTFQQFTQFFPSTHRSNPEVKDLYHAYQNSRHQARTKVKRNIDIEVKRNPFYPDQFNDPSTSASTSEVRDDSRMDHVVHHVDTLDMDIEDVDKHLTLDQAIQELIHAENIYKQEVENLEKDCQEFAQEFQNLDRDMDSIQVRNDSENEVDKDYLVKELQDLIVICDSIMESTLE